MTVAKLCLVYRDGKFSKVVSEIVSAAKFHAAQTLDVGATKWPLTSGIPCQLLDTEVYHVERVYIADYHDGSVRVWDATYPALSLIYVLGESLNSPQKSEARSDFVQANLQSGSTREVELDSYETGIPESLPSLHDKVLEATVAASVNLSPNQKN
ncbi:hypothetical protein SO802_017138 [Lithocarpus litseifolius]|uniref:Uncharacterized protein n=1 Tax=Lithocarpus litseifolius TaxID=425828 RepID=A0AAW2CZ35_9ROSI